MNNDRNKAGLLIALIHANRALATAHRFALREGDRDVVDRVIEHALGTYELIAEVGGLPGKVIDVVDGRVVDMWDEEITEVRQRVL